MSICSWVKMQVKFIIIVDLTEVQQYKNSVHKQLINENKCRIITWEKQNENKVVFQFQNWNWKKRFLNIERCMRKKYKFYSRIEIILIIINKVTEDTS